MKSVETRICNQMLICVCVSMCMRVCTTLSTAVIYKLLHSIINRPDYISELLAVLSAMSA